MNAIGLPFGSNSAAVAPSHLPYFPALPSRVDAQAAASAARAPFSASDSEPNSLRRPRRILVVSRSAPASFFQKFAQYARQWNWHLSYDMIHTGAIPVRWEDDGIIALTSYQSEISDFVAETNLPCVTVGSASEESPHPCIFPDQVGTGQEAARHLLERGCNTFVWAPFVDDAQNRAQLEAFNTAVRQRNGYSCKVSPSGNPIGVASPKSVRNGEPKL